MAVYGIDLGTTYSCLAKFEGNGPTVIKTDTGDDSLASAVYFGEGGNTLIGDEAKGYVQTESYRVVQFVKREIGKQALPHEIDGNSYNAIEISALILKKIAKYAQEQGEIVKDVVITCPAYFGNEERDATKKAGILAGFNVLELINEPTAAAISYAFSQKNLKDETVVVYDLGGGTFDVTVLDIKVKGNGIPSCTVLATDGDDTLGGKDWDQVLFQLICEKMKEENSIDELSPEDENNIRAKVEETKKSLSTKESTQVRAKIDGESMTCTITRAEFEAGTAGLLQQTTDCLDRILRSPSLKNVTIDKILLIGGSSKMPMVANIIRSRYGDSAALESVRGAFVDGDVYNIPIGFFADPATAVAEGAAIYANMLTKAKKNGVGFMMDDGEPTIEIHDIASRTFGVDVYDEDTDGIKLDNLVFKGDPIPAFVTKNYYPVRDNQRGCRFYIYESIITDRYGYFPLDVEGEGSGVVKNPDPSWGLKYLGTLYLKFPPNVTTKVALITEMSVSGSGIHVKVTNSMNGDVEEVDIEFTNNDVELDHNQINALSIE